jgi:hypothetical protein
MLPGARLAELRRTETLEACLWSKNRNHTKPSFSLQEPETRPV